MQMLMRTCDTYKYESPLHSRYGEITGKTEFQQFLRVLFADAVKTQHWGFSQAVAMSGEIGLGLSPLAHAMCLAVHNTRRSMKGFRAKPTRAKRMSDVV